MPEYLCTIAIDIEAASPRDAAEILAAYFWGLDPVTSWIVEIMAHDDGTRTMIEIPDLSEAPPFAPLRANGPVKHPSDRQTETGDPR